MYMFYVDVLRGRKMTSKLTELFGAASTIRVTFCASTRTISLTHSCLGPHKGKLANSVDPGKTPQNAVSDQRVHCLH